MKNDDDVASGVVVDAPEPFRSRFGASMYAPLDEHVGWPYLLHREPTSEEVRELNVKINQLGGTAAMLGEALREDSGEFGELEMQTPDGTLRVYLTSELFEDVVDATNCALGALQEKRWYAAVAHMRHAEALIRLANNWGHADLTYADAKEVFVLEDHLEHYVKGSVQLPTLEAVN